MDAQYDPVEHCVNSYIVWDLNDVKKTKSPDFVSPNIAKRSDLSGAKEVFNGQGRIPINLSMPQQDRGLSYSPRKRQRKSENFARATQKSIQILLGYWERSGPLAVYQQSHNCHQKSKNTCL